METWVKSSKVFVVASLRPALRGWKPPLPILNQFPPPRLRPALRGWKLPQRLDNSVKFARSPTRLEGMETTQRLFHQGQNILVSDPP